MVQRSGHAGAVVAVVWRRWLRNTQRRRRLRAVLERATRYDMCHDEQSLRFRSCQDVASPRLRACGLVGMMVGGSVGDESGGPPAPRCADSSGARLLSEQCRFGGKRGAHVGLGVHAVLADVAARIVCAWTSAANPSWRASGHF